MPARAGGYRTESPNRLSGSKITRDKNPGLSCKYGVVCMTTSHCRGEVRALYLFCLVAVS